MKQFFKNFVENDDVEFMLSYVMILRMSTSERASARARLRSHMKKGGIIMLKYETWNWRTFIQYIIYMM